MLGGVVLGLNLSFDAIKMGTSEHPSSTDRGKYY